ncbi:MAG: CCA tRNA nucleotidyltransferase [Alphaproteobacteria bacterium]|nr:CCA tRNA nucleotidyltransferase [Alphaproteobacteria bacterium]
MIKIKLEFNSPGIIDIFNICNKAGVDVRIVGGAVRDALLGRIPTDIDLAISLAPEDAVKLFSDANYKVLLTGINYGTITVIARGESIQITSLRKDIDTDGRRAIVEYGTSFEEDATRRDFTINSMSYDIISESLYDYYGGRQDLRDNKVIFIGDPEKRIKEDCLRILRFFRFSAYYSDRLDEKGLNSCAKLAKSLEILSKERIYQELTKILDCRKDISGIIKAMQDCAIWQNIGIKLHQGINDLINFESRLWLEGVTSFTSFDIKNIRICFVIYNQNVSEASLELRYLKFSRQEISSIIDIHKFITNILDLTLEKYIYFEICKSWYYNQDNIHNMLLVSYILEKIDKAQLVRALKEMSCLAPVMPLSSEEIMDEGFAGLQLGIRKRYLEHKWIESGFSLTKEELKNLK